VLIERLERPSGRRRRAWSVIASSTGGAATTVRTRITEDLIDELRRISPYDPDTCPPRLR